MRKYIMELGREIKANYMTPLAGVCIRVFFRYLIKSNCFNNFQGTILRSPLSVNYVVNSSQT